MPSFIFIWYYETLSLSILYNIFINKENNVIRQDQDQLTQTIEIYI